MQYLGYLFGDYNSRGGTIFVEASARAKAVARYINAMNFIEGCACTMDEAISIAEDDLICPALLETQAPITTILDLDGTMTGSNSRVWALNFPNKPENAEDAPGINYLLDTNPTVTIAHLLHTPSDNQPEGAIVVRWDDDAYGLIFVPA